MGFAVSRIQALNKTTFQFKGYAVVALEVNTSSAVMLQKLDTTQQAQHTMSRTTSRAIAVVVYVQCVRGGPGPRQHVEDSTRRLLQHLQVMRSNARQCLGHAVLPVPCQRTNLS